MKRPNILVLYTDQQRWDAIGCAGNREIRTPNLDSLAGEGVLFDRFFVQNPVCMPSRVSFLSGKYPSTLGITHMGVPVPDDVRILPQYLRSYGYISANIGKLHFLPHANRDHRDLHPDYGFDHLEISDEPGCYEDAYRAWVKRKAPDQLDHISVGLPPAAQEWYRIMRFEDTVRHPEKRFPIKALAFPGRSDVTHSAFVAEQTMEFIGRRHDRPWLCISGFYSPHSPWTAPQEFLDMYDPDRLTLPEFPADVEAKRASFPDFSDEALRAARHGYYAMVSEVDHHVGRIMARLKETGQSEDTIVIFTSDHGEWLGEHLKYGKGYPGKDSVSRVPLILYWPRGIDRPGRTLSSIVEAVDVLPTLLECCGIQIPHGLQGCSLLPYIEGKRGAHRDSALMEHHGWKNLRTESYRYLCESSGKEMLYDIGKDPYEYADIAQDPAYSDVLSEMRGRMLHRLLEMERPLPRIWSY